MSWLLLKLFPELRHTKAGDARRATLFCALTVNPIYLLRVSPRDALVISIAVFILWFPAMLLGSVPISALVALHYAGLGVALIGLMVSIRRQIRDRILNALLDFGVPVCAFCGYSLRDLETERCPECGKLTRHSAKIADFRRTHVDPIIPELYECFDSVTDARRALAGAKRDIDFLWFCRRTICVGIGVFAVVGSVVAGMIAGFHARAGSPERYFVVPGIVLAFVLPAVSYVLIVKLLRSKVRSRAALMRRRAQRRAE